MATHGDGCFSSRQYAGWPLHRIPCPGNFPRDRSEESRDVFRLAFHFRSQNESVEPEILGFFASGIDQETIRSDDDIRDVLEHFGAGLRSLRKLTACAG